MTSNADLAAEIERHLTAALSAMQAGDYDVAGLAVGSALTALRSEPAAGDVERVARALYEDSNYYAPGLATEVALAPWDIVRHEHREFWLGKARAALAAMAGETGR